MTTTLPDLSPHAAVLIRLVAAVGDDDLSRPTPCADTSVAALLDHVHGFAVGLRSAAQKAARDVAPHASAESLPEDWRARIPRELQGLVAAWAEPAAWRGSTRARLAELPAERMGMVALTEVLVHGWDLAVATGRPFEVDDAAAQQCLDHALWFAAAVPEGRDTIYGPVVPVPDGAPVLDRLLGLTGRDPAWTPPA